MQAHYEVTRLTFAPNGVPPLVSRLERALAQPVDGATLVGALVSEIGALNEVLVLHAIDGLEGAIAVRDARLRSGDPFGVGDALVSLSSATYASFPFLPPATPGRYGPVYEVREYDIKPVALPRLLAAWEAAVPARVELSPLLTAAYALDGIAPRMLHIWPYRDLVERSRVRADAVARGIWPPKGGAEFLSSMRSSIYLPLPFSPLA